MGWVFGALGCSSFGGFWRVLGFQGVRVVWFCRVSGFWGGLVVWGLRVLRFRVSGFGGFGALIRVLGYGRF